MTVMANVSSVLVWVMALATVISRMEVVRVENGVMTLAV